MSRTRASVAGFGTLVIGSIMIIAFGEPLGVGIASGLISLFTAYFGYKRYSLYRTLSESGDGLTGSSVGDTVNVSGTIEPTTDKTKAPFSGTRAVLATWVIDEWNERGDESNWVRRGMGLESEPFTVKTTNGNTIEVDISDKRATTEDSYFNNQPIGIGLQTEKRIVIDDVVGALDTVDPHKVKTGPKENPPQEIQNFLESLSNVNTGSGSITNVLDIGKKHGKRRYVERTLQEGDTVYVHGERAQSNRIEESDETYTIVSSMTSEELRKDIQESATVFAAITAGALATAGVGIFLGL